ncbi:MAG: permease [Ignavibacterium sp.]|nr:MAG: permease [Ignavibacterium sp.]
MENQAISLLNSVLNSFKEIWPYLVFTIPLAVLVQLSGISRHIKRVIQFRPITAILLATVVGAFSPFCSCGVIPIIAALLISGVPLAPVMAFWVASPSMDPEIFFLSVATLGWNLAVWRLISTLVISLSAGFITHYLIQKKWLDETKILRTYNVSSSKSIIHYLKPQFDFFVSKLKLFKESVMELLVYMKRLILNVNERQTICCETTLPLIQTDTQESVSACTSCSNSKVSDQTNNPNQRTPSTSFLNRLLSETWNATFLVIKFMAFSFLLTALIKLYVPSEWITVLLGAKDITSIFAAALIGVPFYTSSLAALPLIGGLLSQGMNQAAALAFLIAGPTTTLPAMAAVWGLTTRRVFILYLSFSLIGATLIGYIYLTISSF